MMRGKNTAKNTDGEGVVETRARSVRVHGSAFSMQTSRRKKAQQLITHFFCSMQSLVFFSQMPRTQNPSKGNTLRTVHVRNAAGSFPVYRLRVFAEII